MRNVLGCAAFLTVRRTHRISRSLFFILTFRSAYQPAPPSSPRPQAPRHTHAQPCPNTTRACSMLHPASHRGNTLEESCCRTCRRLRTKYRCRQTVTFTYPTPFDRGRPASDPARPRAPKPSLWDDQRPRSRPLRPGAAPSPRRARPRSVAEPDENRP